MSLYLVRFKIDDIAADQLVIVEEGSGIPKRQSLSMSRLPTSDAAPDRSPIDKSIGANMALE